MQSHWNRWHSTLERALSGLLIYALPCAMLVLSVLAMLAWAPRYAHDAPVDLPMRVLADPSAGLTADAARTALPYQPPVLLHDTHLAESPFWFSFSVPSPGAGGPVVVEFPSRHLTKLACWDGRKLDPLGEADRVSQQGHLFNSRSGFGLQVQDLTPGSEVLCQARFVGPARLTVQQWDADALQTAARVFERNAGLLEGGIVLLALFVFITALINRNATYVLFAVWLVINLRAGALSAGWDVQWLGHSVPIDWLNRMRLVTVALLYSVTIMLFLSLFREELTEAGYRPIRTLLHGSCVPLLALSVVLPYAQFLPVLWVCTALGCVALVFLLVRIVVTTRSAVAVWYGASIGVTLLSNVYEVVAAAFGLRTWIGTVNSVLAALSSSLLASMAIAIQMRNEHAQRVQAQAELAHTYNVIPLGLFTLDLQGRFIAANPALQAALGPAVLAPGSNHWDQYFEGASWQRLLGSLNAQPVAEFEVKVKGRPGPQQQACRFLVQASRAGERIEGSLQDVTERALAAERLQFLANHDPLTQVLNRNGVRSELEQALRPSGGNLALAYLDLDRFKLINDMFGHGAGDEVLRQVCARIAEVLRSGMHLGRMGGDEFIILMPETTLADATLVCRDVVDTLGNRPYRVGDLSFQVHGSVGLIEVAPGSAAKDAISTADMACREAKKRRGSHLVVFERDSGVFLEHEAEMRLVGLLTGSDEIEGLYLEMQPIMSLRDPRHSLDFEVLLRMRDPEGNVVPTPSLIGAAENSGRMGVIDRWVLGQTLAWTREHLGRLVHTRFICLNLSGASLNDERFMQDVVRMLAQYADVAPRLCLEITESVALHDLENTRRFIAQVHGFGARVALDDFGAGYTSFSYLKELRGDLLKIDGSFVVNMNQHPANVSIVEAIVGLARNLGMKTIAEWAEDSATVQTLAEIGVDYVQGFAVARPQTPEFLLGMRSAADLVSNADLLNHLLLQAWHVPLLPGNTLPPGKSTH
ncbi:MAG: EAL domain-containing protein [Acidovorax sp.]